MSTLSDLEAALETKREADRGTQAWHDARFKLMDMLLNTDDTIAPLVKESDCPTCHGHGGGGGFDRNGSHTAGRYCEYPCPTCGKEADDEP